MSAIIKDGLAKLRKVYELTFFCELFLQNYEYFSKTNRN